MNSIIVGEKYMCSGIKKILNYKSYINYNMSECIKN